MEKLKLHSKGLTVENIEKLAALFPDCLTEAKAEDGSIKHAIDFDLLRQELSADLIDRLALAFHLEALRGKSNQEPNTAHGFTHAGPDC